MKPSIKRVIFVFLSVMIIIGTGIGVGTIWRYATKPSPQDLSYAVIYGNMQQVNALLDKGADVDGFDAEGRTALMNAIINGNTPLLKMLIARGANIDMRVNGNETPLLLAQFHPDIVRILRKAGAKDTGE